jgi:NitT/TauT family transport system substrate-binding protein
MSMTRAAALALLGGAALAPRVPAAAQSGTTPIRIGAPASDSFAIAFFAADGGFFQRAGLDVSVSVFPGSGPVTTAVVGGAIDVGLTDAVQLGNAYNRNIPISAIAGGGLYTPDESVTELCVAKNSPYHTAKDFEGQTIGVITLGSISSAALKAWLTQHGANTQNIKLVEMPFAEMAPAIARGTVAAAYLAEPVMSQVLPELRIIASPYDAIGGHFLISVWFANQDWIAKNHDVAKTFVKAVYDASRWANAHRDLTLPILVKYAKLDPDKLRGMRRARYATELDPRLLQPVLDTAAAYHLIEKPVPAASVIARL